jgi:hypothetical protein
MTENSLSAQALTAIGFGFAGGFALARAHLAALAINVRLYLTPGAAWRPIGLHVVRLAAIVSGFTIAAWFGAPALIAMLAGFTLGRTLALRRHR